VTVVLSAERTRFEQAVLPHLDAAYNLARWLTRNANDAEDVVQEAFCRALRFFGGFRGGDARAWLLKVVRTTCYTWLQRHRARDLTAPLDEDRDEAGSYALNPERLFLQRADKHMLLEAIEDLPVTFREVIVLRELEELTYQEIAGVAGVPLGTVMSRLSRARKQLQDRLAHTLGEEG
jgi:RNA polymerase sigma-70 factor (ECF subfamily)